ncbi:hypothetical protein SPRG_05083 [Saprolegnia parasitica CBS 223.65]|uniref:F-box domain-containing protein n=1 Tax=Saprolegnia parasitica (strain CBS 223.65) TaxID=695850 RepID=A0A067CUA3_SAPPC|nr:hypothetical protein SPRG_05083 [Saprolegnia parasitica CBS 223.65]KDO30372.1 hypothetical protein SPRG_05083 [Saprolegnia parasitica CBS 223.65]|eukprot:XP_012198982.1 hypothetical protein SPRG_05083 [Saprolegnia parasitica CBS 223.65]
MARRRASPATVGSTPDAVEHIAGFVQHHYTIVQLLSALPSSAKTPAVTALDALLVTASVRVAWPEVHIRFAPSAATLRHLLDVQVIGVRVCLQVDVDANGLALLRRLSPVVNHVSASFPRTKAASALQSILAACPRLYSADLHVQTSIESYALFDRLPLSGLAELTLRGAMPASMVIDVIAMLANGRSKRLHLFEVTFSQLSADAAVALCDAMAASTSLTELALDKVSGVDERFLEQRKLPPKLRRLQLSAFFLDVPWREGDWRREAIEHYAAILPFARHLVEFSSWLVTHISRDAPMGSFFRQLKVLELLRDPRITPSWPHMLSLLPELPSLQELRMTNWYIRDDTMGKNLANALQHCSHLRYLSIYVDYNFSTTWLTQIVSRKLTGLTLRVARCTGPRLVQLVKIILASSSSPLRWVAIEKQFWAMSERATTTKHLNAANATLQYVEWSRTEDQKRANVSYWDDKAMGDNRLVVFCRSKP